MLRIVALNEEAKSEDENDDIAVTKEAQETIAESEYMRAIKLKAQGKPDLTLSLLLELLETKVLNEIINDGKNEKLWAIRYNCHKNVAFIYEEMGEVEKALNHFVLAMQIDDTDVYTLNRFGKLALKNNALELAECVFEKCLRRNPSHYGATNSILEIRCLNHNILGAYGWALKIYRRDPQHEQAERVLKEISTKFKSLIPFYEKIFGQAPSSITQYEWNQEKDGSVFPEPKEIKTEDERLKVVFPTDIEQFRIISLDWLSIGHYIVNVYNHLDETAQSMLFTWNFQEILNESSIADMDTQPEQMDTSCTNDNSENSNNNTTEATINIENGSTLPDTKIESEMYSQSPKPSIFATPPLANEKDYNAGDKTPTNQDANSDANDDSKSDSSDASKPKPRRRCSDLHLHFLEQWGWHKTRRHSSRKKPQQDRVEVDTTLNTYLRKMFAKFMNASFANGWPFATETVDGEFLMLCDDDKNCSKKCHQSNFTLNEFQVETADNFNMFIEKLKAKPFDLMKLIYKWLKYVSNDWQIQMPNELKSLYLEIFGLYIRHFDFSTWNQMNANNYIASYRLCLLYLELDYQQKVEDGSAFSFDWKNIFNQLMFKSGTAYVILNEKFDHYKLRLANLEHLWCSYGCQYEKCVACLENMEDIINKQSEDFILHLPNLEQNCITRKLIIKTKMDLKRQIALKTVPKLYMEEKWAELIDVLKSNILQSKDNHECEYWCKDLKVQIEVLLQAFWEINDYEQCLIWAEKFFHYCAGRFVHENKFSHRQKPWAENINYIFSYIEALLLNECFEIVSYLDEKLSRLVQNIIRVLAQQLDGPLDKNNVSINELDMKRLWVVLHRIMLRDENDNPVFRKTKVRDAEEEQEVMPRSFLVLFTAHEFMGKRQLCTVDNGAILQYTLDSIATNLRAPLYDNCRNIVYEYIEQITFCLYGYPQKKARSRHLEDHEASMIELTWPRAIQLFDLYRPVSLPEFNSYKLESISADMEQLLLKILGLMPAELDPMPATNYISDFISGTLTQSPDETNAFSLPFKISTIFFLLGDYYFKSRDFVKAIKYFTLDLACSPARFDSWAGMALSKASKVETKLNGLTPIDLPALILECEETMRCFERCIVLDRGDVLIWIEYGSFAYTLHAYCSRYLKQNADKLSMEEFSSAEERKDSMLKIAYNCFSFAATLLNSDGPEDDGETHEEKWLCQYMLGKIAEKRKEQPKVYLNYYLTAANFLYEHNATYPIKLNHSNPTQLSVEALEIFYRTNSAIIKYLESTKEITREVGDLFNNVLRNLSNSPFAYNKAKIDGNSLNAFKRKIADKMEQSGSPKGAKDSNGERNVLVAPIGEKDNDGNSGAATADESSLKTAAVVDNLKSSDGGATHKTTAKDAKKTSTESNEKNSSQSNVSPLRRESQESAATGTTTTVTSSTTSSTSSSESSTSDSDSDSDETSTEAESKKDKNAPYTPNELKNIFSIVVQNLEECITRFPEHYKSIYRLVYHYMNAPDELSDLKKCEQLLLGQYKTSLGNQINGLFTDRKNNNLFNGIWRIPSSEIDRPGSFSAHLVKCVSLLEQMLMKANNFQLLTDLAMQLHKTPDNDKRYIKDQDRLELYKQSILLSGQVMRNILKNYVEKRDDEEILNFMLEIYKTHKKCMKQINHKESIFIQCLVDTYKLFIQDKVENMPESLNFYDLAVRLCVQEIAARKALEKNINAMGSTRAMGDVLLGIDCDMPAKSMLPPRPIQIPGLPMRARIRNSPVINKQPTSLPSSTPLIQNFDNMPLTASLPSIFGPDILKSLHMMPMMSLLGSLPASQQDKLTRDFYKQILEGFSKQPSISQNMTLLPQNSVPLVSQPPTISFASSLPAETTITPSNMKINKNNQDTATLPTSIAANSNDLLTNMPLGFGLSDLTITPARSLPITVSLEQTKPTASQSANEKIAMNPNIYLQPIPSKQNLTDVPQTLNPLPPNSGKLPPTTTKLQTKAKSAAKNTSRQQKPFERPILAKLPDLSNPVAAIAELAKITPIIKTLSPENQAQCLSAYAELINSNSFQQLQSLPQQKPPRAAPKRKPKAQATQVSVSSSSLASTGAAISGTFSNVQITPILSQTSVINQPLQQPSVLPMLPTHKHIPTFDPNVMTISAIPKTSTTTTLPGSNFTQSSNTPSPSSMVNLFPQQSNVQISPTKTLQEKLAERQKANQLNEANASTTAQRKPSVDVIILD